MKRLSAAGIVVIMIFASLQISYGQQSIKPLPLSVAYYKTTNLIFPYPVKSVDRGSRDVLVQKASGVENVVQVKAAVEHFNETNLTVITADGHLYSFMLTFSANPHKLNLKLQPSGINEDPPVQFMELSDGEYGMRSAAETVADKQLMFRRKKDRKHGITLQITGAYIRDDIQYFQLELQNDTHIGFDIGQFHFFIRDKKKARRTATQEMELHPLLTLGNTATIKGHSSQTVVVAVEKFTIPDKKELVIQLMEKNGGRHLELTEGNKVILKSNLL